MTGDAIRRYGRRAWRALRRNAAGLSLAALYLLCVVSANWLAQRYGLVPIGFGLTVVAGTFAAGAALLVRNLAQDMLGRPLIVGLMLLGTVLSWWFASPALAIASAVAFGLSETADMTIYTWLRSTADRPDTGVLVYRVRRGKLVAVVPSDGRPSALLAAALLGSVVDTLVFLHLAGFPVTPSTVLGQLVVKVGISALCAAGLTLDRRVADAST